MNPEETKEKLDLNLFLQTVNLENNLQLRKILEKLKELWVSERNPNALLFAYMVVSNPHLIEDTVIRAKKSKLNHNLKKSFLDRLVNKLMNNNKHSTGKKIKIRNHIIKTLKSLTNDLSLSSYILLTLVKSVPNYDIRRQKYGSGHLTRSVRLTLPRKIVWYLNVISKHIKDSSPRKKLKNLLLTEFKELENKSSRSVLLSKKKESEQNALRSNIQ